MESPIEDRLKTEGRCRVLARRLRGQRVRRPGWLFMLLGLLPATGLLPSRAAAQAADSDLPTHDCRSPAFVTQLYEALARSGSSSAVEAIAFDSLARSLRCAERLIDVSPDDAAGWAAAGAAHLLVGEQQRVVFDSRAMRTGATHLEASVSALLRALRLGSDRPHIPTLLWLALERQRYWSQYGSAARALRQVLDSRRRVGADMLLLRTRLAWRVGERDSALAFARAYLAAGGDSSVGFRELARELLRAGQDEEGVAAYWRGLASRLSPEAEQFYREDALLIAGPAEALALRDLPAAMLRDTLARFWARRDVETARGAGTRIVEQFRRLEYVLEHFRARERRMEAVASPDRLARGAAFASALDTAYRGDALWLGTSFNHLRRRVHWLRDVDDRGIVYMRHGPPDKRAGPAWLYNRGGKSLMITVTPGQDGFPGTSCDLIPRYCVLEMQSSQALRLRLWQESAEMTVALLESDGLAPRFRRDLAGGVQIHGLAGTGSPGILVAMAIRGAELIPRGEAGTLAYHLRLRISTLGADGSRHQLDTTRIFMVDAPLTGNQYLQFLQWVPARPGTWEVGIAVEQGEPERPGKGFRPPVAAAAGAVVSLRGVHVPDPGRSTLDMSDLVVGLEAGGLRWWNGERDVLLNPLDVTPRRVSPQLYFELFGATGGEEYLVTLTIRPRGGRQSPVTVVFREKAPGGSFSRVLQVPELGKGVYEVTVGIGSEGRREELRRSAVITIGD